MASGFGGGGKGLGGGIGVLLGTGGLLGFGNLITDDRVQSGPTKWPHKGGIRHQARRINNQPDQT